MASSSRALPIPREEPFTELIGGGGNQAVSTTMAFVRLLRGLDTGGAPQEWARDGTALGIEARGVQELTTDGGARLRLALVPFVSRRGIVRIDDLMGRDADDHAGSYRERMRRVVATLCAGFDDGADDATRQRVENCPHAIVATVATEHE